MLSGKILDPIYMEKQWIVKDNCSSSLRYIITSIGLTASGLLCYLIPGVGWVVGTTLLSGGISGLIESYKNKKITLK